MKLLLTCLFIVPASLMMAQQKLIPGKNAVEQKWIHDEQYQVNWYAIRDTTKMEIGKVNTQIIRDKKNITVITRVEMKQMKSPWVDTTVAEAKSLDPVYHSSQNAQRNMSLNFGTIVTGIYFDKVKKVTAAVNDTTREKYFDSNLYPTLIRWLPLVEGYTKDIAIYDYNPAGRKGVIKASVTNVKKGTYRSSFSGEHAVWIVTVSDEIGGGESGTSTYYVDIYDRKLWNQEINAGGRKMAMECIE